MDYFKTKINNNERNMHFLLYCYTFFIYGATVNGLGPLIPYFSAHFGIPQTQYSILFPGRTLGYVVGALVSKIITKKFEYHTIMVYSALGFSASAFLFSQSQHIYWQTFFIWLNTTIIAIYDVIINTSVLIYNKDEDKQFWVQIGHGMFGVGCLVSPILVYLLQLKIFAFFAIINLVIIYGYYKLETPEVKKQQQAGLKQLNLPISFDHNQQIIVQKQQKKQQKQKDSQQVTFKILMLLSSLIFLYIGEEISFGVWVPTYSVLMKISQKEEATVYSTLFYLSVTISRFVLAVSPTNNQTSKRIKLFLILNICVSLLALIMHNVSPHFGCYLVSILYGITIAPLFAMYFTISKQNGFILKDHHYSTMMILSVFGQAILASIVGYLLNYTLAMIFLSMLIFGALQYGFLIKLDRQFAAEKQKTLKLNNNKELNEFLDAKEKQTN